MTAFDIYSAVGDVGEDILEESEIMLKKKITKIIPLMAAAACFAVFAVGLSHALRNDNIEQPVTDISNMTAEVTAAETYPAEADLDGTAAAGGDVTSNAVTSLDPQITGEGIVIYDPSAQTTSVSLFNTETAQIQTGEQTTIYTAVTNEETTVCPTNITVSAIEEEEIVLIPKWEDLSDLDRYIYLEYAGNDYGITMEKFDKSELTFLRNSEIYGIDEYTDKKYSMECAVYKIDNIDAQYMVAVPTADGLYTGFKRNSFRYDTLGEAVEGTGILKRNIIGDTVSISDDSARHTTIYTVPNLQQAAEKLLNSAPNTDVHVNPPNDRGLVSYSIYGKNGKTVLTVYATGYVYFGVSYFSLGEEYAAEFIDYVMQNATNIDIIPYDEPNPNDITIPE